MKVIRINPQGYCKGVSYALEKVNNALNDPNTLRPIYLLGDIIHNKHVSTELENKGAITLRGKTRLEMLDEISSGTVVFSAHGVSPLVYDKANEKGLNIIDATCPNVLFIHSKIKKYLKDGYSIIYIGTKNHPEVEGVLGIDSNIILVSDLSDIDNLNITNEKIYITNQTTLSLYDIKDMFDLLKYKYPTSIIDDKICNATTVRQRAIKEQEHVDLCIIVGDKMSSNSKKLVSVALSANIKAIIIDDLKSLDKTLLNGVNSVSVSSGASTPSYLVDEVINYLESL